MITEGLVGTQTAAHLVHRQVDASVGDDAQHVGDVALVESPQSFPPEDLLGAV